MSALDTWRERGNDLAEHIACCSSCARGNACPDGDNAAEAEYRAFQDWRRFEPGQDAEGRWRRAR